MRTKVTDEIRRGVINLRKISRSVSSISFRFQISETTVRKILKEHEEEENMKTKTKVTEKTPVKKIYEPIIYACSMCGEEFTITPVQQKRLDEKGYYLPKRCEKCRDICRQTIEIECVDCGKTFTITKAEEHIMLKRNLQMPKRCHQCIQFKKESNRLRDEKIAMSSESLDFDPDKD